MHKQTLDHQDHIIQIIHDAIQDGLFKGVKLKKFRQMVETLKGNDLEDYLQTLWDKYPQHDYGQSKNVAHNR